MDHYGSINPNMLGSMDDRPPFKKQIHYNAKTILDWTQLISKQHPNTAQLHTTPPLLTFLATAGITHIDSIN
ncbi:hypothetical protein XF_1396 [Xylella fastidiosa 9a5c]|uniref:Uncharacterized protein n=1 Tax=Xylella fastidiosa (strain 9a5c) TaxID=160492 RepID=Q9PDI3_XYLFA|nr:hypothetical protein XF_1396 [Xylella fastidiosa 9a5c]